MSSHLQTKQIYHSQGTDDTCDRSSPLGQPNGSGGDTDMVDHNDYSRLLDDDSPVVDAFNQLRAAAGVRRLNGTQSNAALSFISNGGGFLHHDGINEKALIGINGGGGGRSHKLKQNQPHHLAASLQQVSFSWWGKRSIVLVFIPVLKCTDYMY